ncbi:hypothetical protein [Streptomyces sp. NPDC093094]|uniref:hypothetical protein n=1 Tax=Streptomyces sp. NPDC093094 TaxID=3366026 RepID=UPI0037F15E83
MNVDELFTGDLITGVPAVEAALLDKMRSSSYIFAYSCARTAWRSPTVGTCGVRVGLGLEPADANRLGPQRQAIVRGACSASARARYSEATEGYLPAFLPVLMVSFLAISGTRTPLSFWATVKVSMSSSRNTAR